MIHVAFYVDNNLTQNIDCTNILETNPGIGGTEYLFYITAYGLQKLSDTKFHVTLLTAQKNTLPKDLYYFPIGGVEHAIAYCQKHNINILIVNYNKEYFSPNIFEKINSGLQIVIWAHNVLPQYILSIIAKTKSIKKIVNVGREQLDLYRDHLAFTKSTYIYNGIPLRTKEYYNNRNQPFAQRKNEVTYLGSIVPIKGFHILAEAWPEIIKAIPDAHLNVIGSGNLYGNIYKLGEYGIAEENYEKQFMKYLTTPEGKILPSVTFYGKLGNEKNQILERTKIGVPNPSGLSETFCLSAIEMELCGCKIVTKKHIGFLDTVPKQCGILYNNEKDLAKTIIQELKNNYHNYNACYQYIYDNFRIEIILSEWKNLLMNINAPAYTNTLINKEYNFKKIREINRIIKSHLPFGYFLPTINTYIKLSNTFFRTKIPILY